VVLTSLAVVPGDAGLDQLPPGPPQAGERAFLVRTHQARIAGDVGRQDRDELAFDLLRWRSLRSQRSLPLKRSLSSMAGKLYHAAHPLDDLRNALGRTRLNLYP
jgi:hypothetical protein